MTKLQMIRALWSSIYDLLLYIGGRDRKSITEIQDRLDYLEYVCRKWENEPEQSGESVNE